MHNQRTMGETAFPLLKDSGVKLRAAAGTASTRTYSEVHHASGLETLNRISYPYSVAVSRSTREPHTEGINLATKDR